MTGVANSVGARRVVGMLLGEDQVVRWSRPVLRFWGFLFVGFVFLFAWLPSRGAAQESSLFLWIASYTVYLLVLEILGRKAQRLYESQPCQLFRVHFNLAMITVLMLVGPPAASGYLWFFFSMPMLAILLYFGRPVLLVIVYLEICAAMLAVSARTGSPDFATMLAQDAILGLLTAVLYFFMRFFPRLREEGTLLKATTTLMHVLDRGELAQLLADAAKEGIPDAEAAVVHLLGGEGNQTLVPAGSSHVDLSALGRSLMSVGVGIAGHAVQNRQTINVPDVDKDERYHRLPSSFVPLKSLLVAPMYVGDKSVGTISVHSAKKKAFSERDERFLTMLAAQGAATIANAELYNTRSRRRQEISGVLEASRAFGLNQSLDDLLETIATEVCRCSGYQMAVVNLLDETSGEIVVKAMAGVPPAGRRKLEGLRIPHDVVTHLLQDKFRIGQSYFIRHDRRPDVPDLSPYTFTPDLGERKPGGWHQEDMLIVPIRTREGELLGYLSVDDPSDRQIPSLDTIQALEILVSVSATAIENARLYDQAQKEIAERRRVEAALEQHAAQLALLNDIGGKIAAVLDLESVLDRAARLVQESFGYYHVALFTVDRERDELVMRAKAGDFAHLFPPDHRLKLDQGMVGWVGRHGKTLLINDVDTEPRYINLYPDVIPTRSELSVPILAGDDILGVLDVQSPQTNAFDQNDVMVMETLSNQIGVAIENGRLYKEAQRRAAELDALNYTGRAIASTLDLDQVLVTVLEEVRCLLGVLAASIWLIDQETGELVCRQAAGRRSEIVRGWRLAPGQGIAGWVTRSGESLIVPDTRTDERHYKGVEQQIGLTLRSILTVPLRVKEDVIGALQVMDTEAERFDQADLLLVEALAASAAIAIDNARLYEETDRLRAFNEDIVQSMEEGILLEDANAHITFVNRKTVELLGYTREELIGQHCTIIVAPQEVSKIEEEIVKRSQGIASRYETVLLTKEGQHVPVIVSATPAFKQGSFAGALCVYTDITNRKQQEIRLQEYLSAVTSSLALHTSLEGLYQFIVEAGTRFLSARDCSLFLANDGDDNALELVAATTSPLCADRPRTARPGCGLVAHVAETCQPVRLLGKDVLQHPLWNRELWARLGWDFDPQGDHSLLAVPMRTPADRLVGVLVARDAENDEGFSEFDERLLQTLATNAAAGIERVRSVEKARADAIRAERKRLETDLHEAMNLLATGVRWEAEILADEIEHSDLEAADVSLNRLQGALTRAYTDLRSLLEDLRDPTLEQEGLLIALTKRAELIGRGRIVVSGDLPQRLPSEIEGTLYRVGQEAMSNAVKHSGFLHNPNVRIEVWLEGTDEQVRLYVKDDGVGFDVESTLALAHKWGLRRFYDILHEIDGELEIDSAPDKGTTICAIINLTGRNYEQ
ncbi:MAG: GAF domain-containing protein [Anaerolineae bacterium]